MKDEIFYIKGLGGKKTLKGEVSICGAKNAVLPLFASSLLFDDEVKFNNIPDIEDCLRMSEILEKLGVSVIREKKGQYILNASKTNGKVIDEEIAKKLRASIILTGPVLARFGKVSFPHPGGCVIGARPIDIFIDGYKSMGATVKEKGGLYIIETKNGLKGANIFLRNPSVTATEAFVMAAILADGETVIKNAATEPEIMDLIEFLVSCGAKIKGEGTSTITIVGSKKLLKARGFSWRVVPDRIEAGSFLILGALCADNLLISNCEPKHLEALTSELIASGVPITIGQDFLQIKNNAKISNKKFKSFNIKTHEYPGFPTDLQAPAIVFLTQVLGESNVFETIFENRLGFAEDLVTMGANIRMLDAHRIIVKGPSVLKGRELYGPDLRAGLAFVIAGIVGKGESRIHNVYYIDRGYEEIDKKLRSIGVDIKRI